MRSISSLTHALFWAFFLAFSSVQARAESDSVLLARKALQDIFPEGRYESRNPLDILNSAETNYANYISVSVAQSRPVFKEERVGCTIWGDGSQLVKFTNSGESFKIEVLDVVEPNNFLCSITFTGNRLIVKEGNKSRSLWFPCQGKLGELGGGIDWNERRKASNPLPLCSGVKD